MSRLVVKPAMLSPWGLLELEAWADGQAVPWAGILCIYVKSPTRVDVYYDSPEHQRGTSKCHFTLPQPMTVKEPPPRHLLTSDDVLPDALRGQVVRASHGGRDYMVPGSFDVGGLAVRPLPIRSGDDGALLGYFTGSLTVIDGTPYFTSVQMLALLDSSPSAMARLPWGRIMGDILSEVAALAAWQPERTYRRRDDDLLDEVERLRAEADGLGVPYAPYVRERLGYARDSYVRRLAKKARDRHHG